MHAIKINGKKVMACKLLAREDRDPDCRHIDDLTDSNGYKLKAPKFTVLLSDDRAIDFDVAMKLPVMPIALEHIRAITYEESRSGPWAEVNAPHGSMTVAYRVDQPKGKVWYGEETSDGPLSVRRQTADEFRITHAVTTHLPEELSVKDAATYAGVSRKTILNWIGDNLIEQESVRTVGREYRIKRVALEAFMRVNG